MSSPKVGTIAYIRHFAWMPKNLFPQYDTKVNQREFVWFRFYYKVYKWEVKTWVVNDPTLQGWTWVGNTKYHGVKP